jgi:hypothetical protein
MLMTDREDRLVAELEQAWSAIFGGPPAMRAEGDLLLAILVDRMPMAPPYGDAPYARSPPDPPKPGRA